LSSPPLDDRTIKRGVLEPVFGERSFVLWIAWEDGPSALDAEDGFCAHVNHPGIGLSAKLKLPISKGLIAGQCPRSRRAANTAAHFCAGHGSPAISHAGGEPFLIVALLDSDSAIGKLRNFGAIAGGDDSLRGANAEAV
jgi:hypothetical protein